MRPGKEQVAQIMAAVAAQKESEQWTKDNGQFIPNPTTWLNQERWEDDLPKAKEAHDELQYDGPCYREMDDGDWDCLMGWAPGTHKKKMEIYNAADDETKARLQKEGQEEHEMRFGKVNKTEGEA